MELDAERSIDLRGVACPMNWVQARLELEGMEPGQLLEVLLDDGDPIRNVPMSMRAEGHRIVGVQPLGEGFRLVVQRA